MADRDPEVIKAEIDAARERLASTVDTLATRANPQRIADEAKSKALMFIEQPKVKYTLMGVGALVFLLLVRRLFRRY